VGKLTNSASQGEPENTRNHAIASDFTDSQPAGGQRPDPRAAHQSVGVAFENLIESTRSGRYQGDAAQGVNQGEEPPTIDRSQAETCRDSQ